MHIFKVRTDGRKDGITEGQTCMVSSIPKLKGISIRSCCTASLLQRKQICECECDPDPFIEVSNILNVISMTMWEMLIKKCTST